MGAGRRFKAYPAHPAYRDLLLAHQAPHGPALAAARDRLAERRRARAAYHAIATAALADPTTSHSERFLARALLDVLSMQ